jgi:hypothetical protein
MNLPATEAPSADATVQRGGCEGAGEEPCKSESKTGHLLKSESKSVTVLAPDYRGRVATRVGPRVPVPRVR